MDIKTLYRRERKNGWAAMPAFHNAKTRMEWHEKEWGGAGCHKELGMVRLNVKPDNDPDLSWADKEDLEKANLHGVWGIIGEFWNGEKWEHADSVWGFIGNDWENSGYDTDVMRNTLDAAKKLHMCPLCGNKKKAV